ncbi:MAG: NUDIX hydrolase [Streptosporangiales bacterium]|nr:NUDIX hydrolase [Streptosporangiales bacterium]
MVTPHDAATVVLLRDGARGVEVYLLRRVAAMAFAAGMYVFPGGRVDARDADPELSWAGPSRDDWAGTLGADTGLAAALVCAAVRETFEESGVLLAGERADDVVADTVGAGWEADRAGLVDHTVAFAEFLRRRGLVLRTDLLRAWSRWITPEFEPRRYDARFFVAALPAGQRARDVGGESDRVAWLRPAEALGAFGRGELDLLPPTAETLYELAEHASVASVLAAAARRAVEPVLPRARLVDEGAELVLPGDDAYEDLT